MEQGNRAQIIAGNWKMHKTISESQMFVKELIPMLQEGHGDVYLAVPFTSIAALCQ